MPYLEKIKATYKLVQNGDVSQTSVKMALQYENWRNLHKDITSNICNHDDYSSLDADSGDRPVPTDSQLDQDCQIASRSHKRIRRAYSLYRHRPSVSSPPFDTLDTGDFPQIWKLLEMEQNERWVAINPLTLRSEQDLRNLVCRLGLYHWRTTSRNTPVFCLELSEIDCVKPNALDAGLAFYFHQTLKPPGRTRNLRTGEPDMEEWLCLKANQGSTKCIGGCLTGTRHEIDMNNYFNNCAKRIRDNKGQKIV